MWTEMYPHVQKHLPPHPETEGLLRGLEALTERVERLESALNDVEPETFREGYDVGYSEALADVALAVEQGTLVLVEPQVEYLFVYQGVRRRGHVVGIAPSASSVVPINLLIQEVWNSRDGEHAEPVVKSFRPGLLAGLEKV